MPWREVLERALDESASPEHAGRRRLGEPEAAHLDVRHVIYALRLAAGRRKAKSLTLDEYEDDRRESSPRRRAGETYVGPSRRNCCRPWAKSSG
jgi:hypothetical protein